MAFNAYTSFRPVFSIRWGSTIYGVDTCCTVLFLSRSLPAGRGPGLEGATGYVHTACGRPQPCTTVTTSNTLPTGRVQYR